MGRPFAVLGAREADCECAVHGVAHDGALRRGIAEEEGIGGEGL